MSKKRKHVKPRKYRPSEKFTNVKNLLPNNIECAIAEVFKYSDDQLIAEDHYGKRISSNFQNLSTEDQQSTESNICKKAQAHLKRCRCSRKPKNCTRPKKCRKVSQSKDSGSRDDSNSSSDSSSDLRSTAQHVNKPISSRLVNYSFYSVVNISATMDQGTCASALCRSFLALFLKLDDSSVYSNFLDTWDKAGQKIIVLKGYNHKHLQYLAKKVRHIAVESNTLYRTTGQAQVMLVLSAFGREEDMEEAFDNLCYLH